MFLTPLRSDSTSCPEIVLPASQAHHPTARACIGRDTIRRWCLGAPILPARRPVTESRLTPEFFQREDEEDDSVFYSFPRLVVHIDEGAIAAVSRLFRDLIPENSDVLDLMSSWRSHWPEGHPKKKLVGLGLNRVEMEENPDLDEVVVHNVNNDPELPFEDESFDAVVITVSAQYLTKPIQTFNHVARVLRPGGKFIVSFSNRMFGTKAVLVWRNSTDRGRVDLVGTYMEATEAFEDIQAAFLNPDKSPPGDPMYAVYSRKAAEG
ncbi:MAG: class I SAM-dependent methyltransferase [SAR202 cluster bacterium]|nr:class I SAM-dependent methyltransferase [SAR202 cluster bacterium]MQG34709.1 class I SAM-dependent methyltransferase [SAR202 cluster bacterium]HAA94133.1 methyltransferase type 11 [Dehalococcoidia bacterium]HCP23160.1 methyltransferase type 11 [Dehalococcoidia bacterium]|tara:strand:+ start:11064 stop:11858 length:795 start_codon:yes stop_codon:yes gene_type:complete